MNQYYEGFLNLNSKKRELEKVKRIQSEIYEKYLKDEKKLKRKSPKKPKTEDINEGNLNLKPDSKIFNA